MNLDDIKREDIEKIAERQRARVKILEKYESYAYGSNWDILHKDDESKPDNKIPVPIGKSIVTDVVGYAGRPGEIITEYRYYPDDDARGEEDDITKLLQSFNEYNKEGLRNSQHLKTSLSVGISWELWYISEKMKLKHGMSTPEFMIIDPKESYPVWSDDIKPKLNAFARVWCNDDAYIIDIYKPGRSERWIKKRDRKDGEEAPHWERDKNGDTIYPYKNAPAIPMCTDMMDEPIFKAQIPLMDSYDQTYSKMKNEVDRFNAAIMLLAGILSTETKQDIREGKKILLEDLNSWERWPEYLTKNLQGVDSFHNKFLDRTIELIRETLKVVNFQDKNMSGISSGIALRLKLVGMEFVVSDIEVYFREGLDARFSFYQDIFTMSTYAKVDWDKYAQEITWKRNLPVDDKEKVEIAAMLLGLGFTMEKIIKYLPNSIIQNMTDKEIEEMLTKSTEKTVNALSIAPGKTVEAVEAAKLSGIQIESAGEIIAQVVQGLITREAGIDQLMIFLGLTKEQAEKVIGPKARREQQAVVK